MAIGGHIISFRFLPISGHLRATQENQNQLIQSKRISCNWGKRFSVISKGKVFRADRKKILISLITGEPVSAVMCSTILVITKIYIFLLYFTSVLLLIMQSQSASIA